MSKILTLQEAQKRLEERGTVTDIWVGDWEIYHMAVFFTDDHGMKNTYGFKTWVPCTTRLGVNQVKTMEDYIRLFEKDEKILWSEEEVIEFRNSLYKKPC